MTNPYPNQQPAPGVPNVNQPVPQPAPTQGVPPQNGEVVQERTVPTSGSTVAEPKKKKNWLWWLIPIILVPVLAVIAWFVLGDRLAGEDTEGSNSEVVETATVDELAPAPAPLDEQEPFVTETLDPLPPADPAAPPVENPDGMVAPEAPAPEQAPEVVDPVVPGGEEMAHATDPAPAQ